MFGPLLIVAFLTIIFGILYASSSFLSVDKERVESELATERLIMQPAKKIGQVVLKVGEQKVVGKNGLVYRGLDKKQILLDLYLLEMDPQQAYRKKFTKKAAKERMVIGGQEYRLYSVNKSHLILKNTSKSQ